MLPLSSLHNLGIKYVHITYAPKTSKMHFINIIHTHESPTIGLCTNTYFGPKIVEKTLFYTKNKAFKKIETNHGFLSSSYNGLFTMPISNLLEYETLFKMHLMFFFFHSFTFPWSFWPSTFVYSKLVC
jgi:hypothetical protein